MLEELLAKGFWRNGKCSRAAISAPYRARLQDETPLYAKEYPRKESTVEGHIRDCFAAQKSARMEELMTKMPPMLFNQKVPSWNLFVRGHRFGGGGLAYFFSGWGGQGRGLRGSVSSIYLQHRSSCLFARSMATLKGTVDRRKRDLARREFQLLRRKTKLLKATLSPEERLLWRLRKANRKKAVLLQRLKKYELEEDPEPVHDPELITSEQLQALKKIGYKNRNYVPVGRRGVYGGVVQNMHMHWKFHETVQVDCHIFKREDIRSIARQLTVLSGGIVIDVHQATTIIMYRGRNYRQPKTQMIPPNTLSKRKALFKSKFLQGLEGLETNIRNIEAELQIVRRKKKESIAEGADIDKINPLTVANDRIEDDQLLAQRSEISSDDYDDDGLFSWGSDSLDEDELSDADDVNHKEVKEVHEKKVTKPISWTSGDAAPQGGKKKRLTAKELILAEQELFRNRRQANTAQKTGSISVHSDKANSTEKVDVDERVKTDDEDDNAEKGDGISKCHVLQSSEDDVFSCTDKKDTEKTEVASRGKRHAQIKNKKIANFMKDFVTDSEEETEKLGSYFDDLDDLDQGKTCSTADMESFQTKQTDDEK